MKLIELAKKYHFCVENNRLVVPATMPDSEILFLLSVGYDLIFELTSKQKEG
uniref:Uncharacterized protein n=1 Tax=viral metagenome TaxID=1070528 RepID=A0A6M3XXE6_9ZZZZ